MQDDSIYQQLAAEYLATLTNRDVPHKKVFLCFSGVPGCGKTTLAQRLRDDLGVQYVRHDDIRALARSMGYDVEKIVISSVSKIAVDEMMAHDANKFMILDAGLDRSWHIYFDSVKEYNALPIIIRIDVPKSTVIERIKKRSEDDFGKFDLDAIDTFYEQFENAKRHFDATITIGADYNYADVLAKVKALTE